MAAVTAVMYGIVRCVPLVLPEATFVRLAAEIVVGVAVYVGLSLLFRLEAFREIVAMLHRQLAEKRR